MHACGHDFTPQQVYWAVQVLKEQGSPEESSFYFPAAEEEVAKEHARGDF